MVGSQMLIGFLRKINLSNMHFYYIKPKFEVRINDKFYIIHERGDIDRDKRSQP